MMVKIGNNKIVTALIFPDMNQTAVLRNMLGIAPNEGDSRDAVVALGKVNWDLSGRTVEIGGMKIPYIVINGQARFADRMNDNYYLHRFCGSLMISNSNFRLS